MSKIDSGYPFHELEAQYSPTKWCKREETSEIIVQGHSDALLSATKIAKGKFQTELDVRYALGEECTYDVYFPPADKLTDSSPVVVYIHGVYWVAFTKEHCGAFIDNLLNAGCIFISVGYDLAPSVTLEAIIQEIRTAVLFIIPRFPKRAIYLCGHSAGAHLSAMMLHTDWKQFDYNTIPISGIILLSGVYYLSELVDTSYNKEVKLTKEDADRLSPLLLPIDKMCIGKCKILVVVAELDSPVFKFHTERYYQFLKEYDIPATYILVPNVGHFYIVEYLVNPEYSLTRSIIGFVTGAAGDNDLLLHFKQDKPSDKLSIV